MATTTTTVTAPAGCSLNVLRFNVSSSDVIDEQARINVYEEKTERVIWYKERFLGDEEIVEHIVHNPTSTICWTIHRPKRGWYIRIRSRAFPPGTFISLLPSRRAEGALQMVVRTGMPGGSPDRTSVSSSSTHSYPPTPTSTRPPSLSTTPTTPTPGARPPSLPMPTQVCEFVMMPVSSAPTTEPAGFGFSFVSRALAALIPSHSNSFTLARVPAASVSAPPPYTSVPDVVETPVKPLFPPLLSFHDRTPVYSIGSRTGAIEIDKAEERLVGIDTSFWIAVALTYLEFLKERESYLAALND